MNALVKHESGALAQAGTRMAVADIISHVSTVQEVMRAVMKPEVHYGTIPGTDKPTLFKPGAEVLCMAFRIADSYQIEDLSTPDTVRYRVTCTGTHQTTGVVLGTGMGEASSAEEKYKWRKAWDDEFNATPANLRRVKSGKNYSTKQVRTEPADLANTILKMANKRAKMAMVLNVTAASDCFSQDLEDMDEALRDHLSRHPDEVSQEQPAARPAQPVWPDDKFVAQFERWKKAIEGGLKTVDEILILARSRGALSDEQEKSIKAVKPIPKTGAESASESAPLDDPFVRDMA